MRRPLSGGAACYYYEEKNVANAAMNETVILSNDASRRMIGLSFLVASSSMTEQ